MRLADLDRVTDLAGQLRRLDEFAGPATLAIGDMSLELGADETADFVEWKRGRIQREMRRLGVDNEIPEGRPGRTSRAAPPARIAPAKTAARPKRRAAITDIAAAPAPAPLSREAALAEARRRILGPFEEELRKSGGYLTDPVELALDLEIMAEKRQHDIEALAQELMRPKTVAPCAECAAPSTTIIAGTPYCKDHAAAARRPALPDNVVALLPSAAA
jgi:hypothetical protein